MRLCHTTHHPSSVSSVLLFSHVQLFATPWTAALQASLSITNSQSLPKLMSIESVMPSNHLILCLLLLPSVFSSNRVSSNESALLIRWPKYWSFSFNISPSNEHPSVGQQSPLLLDLSPNPAPMSQSPHVNPHKACCGWSCTPPPPWARWQWVSYDRPMSHLACTDNRDSILDLHHLACVNTGGLDHTLGPSGCLRTAELSLLPASILWSLSFST